MVEEAAEPECSAALHLGWKYCADDTSKDIFGEVRRGGGQRADWDAGAAHRENYWKAAAKGFCADFGADLGAVGALHAAVLFRGSDCAVSASRRRAQDDKERGEPAAGDGTGGRRSREPADCLWRRDCGRCGRLCGVDLYARHSVYSGSDDIFGAGGFVGGRQDGREPAGGQEPGGQLPSAAGSLCRH